MKNFFNKGIFPFIVFFLCAIYITYPLVFHIGDYVTSFGDEIFIAWVQNWVIHALSINPLMIFQANIFYPFQNTLAYSETFISSSVFVSAIKLIIQEPIATFNITLISSFLFLGFSVYLLCFFLTKNVISSVFAGVLVIFSPAVLSFFIHVQMLWIPWVPLSILFFCTFSSISQVEIFWHRPRLFFNTTLQ